MADISKSIPKLDAKAKIAGEALYVSDIRMPGMLFARTVRAAITKGKIIQIHKPSLPEGYFIIDESDIEYRNIVKIIYDDMPYFAKESIEHYGEPILLVIGPNKETINEIVKLIIIDYEKSQPLLDFSESKIHYDFTKGDPDSAFKNASRIVEMTYETGYQEQAYIEPQGMIGYPEAGGKITLVGSIQCPYYVKNAVIHALGCDESQIRVIQAVVGGAFGGKEEFPSLIACELAVAVKKLQKPIKLIYEREEDIEVTTKRHPSKIRMEAAIDGHLNVTAIKAKVALDGGAYIGLSGVVLSRAMIAASGAYTFKNLAVSGDVYKTNTVPNGAFRGFGAPQMLFAIEMFMHHIAKETHQDPFLFRMRHLARQGDATSTNGTFRDPIIMDELIKVATEKSDYHKKVKIYSMADSHKGIGMSYFLHGCGFTGSGESTHINAKIRLHKRIDDVVEILVAAVDMGQGVKTTMSKIVANVLDIPISQVRYDNPDTDKVPDSGPTVASRTIMIVGGLVARAAKELKAIWQTGVEQKVNQQYAQPTYIKWDESTFQGDAYPAYSWGVNVVEVEIDPLTAQVEIINVVSAYDVGKAVDERIIIGQADGGITQGLAYGYMEHMTQKDGRIRQKSMTDYIIPTAMDISPMSTYLIDNPYPLGPYGAKGAGELTLVGGAPAIALAIEMAIKQKVTKIPATPEYLMELMHHE
jgi:CO/xanthine dehydrogenase Mo-binding subunit